MERVIIRESRFKQAFNDKGFIFPWALSISAILFFIVMTTVLQYENQIISTDSSKNYNQLQSLFHYSEYHLLKDSEQSFTENNNFHLPIGYSEVECKSVDETTFDCTWDLRLESGAKKEISKTYISHKKTDAH